MLCKQHFPDILNFYFKAFVCYKNNIMNFLVCQDLEYCNQVYYFNNGSHNMIIQRLFKQNLVN